MCEKAKTMYYNNKFENCNQSELFKLANSLLDGKEKKYLPDHEDINKLVNHFNDFFYK